VSPNSKSIDIPAPEEDVSLSEVNLAMKLAEMYGSQVFKGLQLLLKCVDLYMTRTTLKWLAKNSKAYGPMLSCPSLRMEDARE